MEKVIMSVIKYILQAYPYKDELSASRLTKMLYLTDWKAALELDTQLTNTVWHFHHYGPYVDDFVKMAKQDSDIKVTSTTTVFGGSKQLFELSGEGTQPITLEPQLKEIVDFVINATKDKNYEEFIKLVYSTYPVLSSNKYSDLDLVQKAREYKAHLVAH
ncbi:SocA family protein [Vibrio cholerae]|uniref:Panacea domain-containing protein n=2 Tax=Vibrio cholerae TaxID=666 RepID=UPI000892B887|nr:Panacea domain-containing protein [Vibrio cholerae]EGQ8122384.1 SocA family protein [Vibrio cholerae]EKF9854010.1 SocA family protein [Vibrio cholerae]MBJ6915181.1 SocA family protein [Vibrio cholerae]MBJ6918887.1 SocA family protein [Vibrio cholerae]MBJ6930381.1 SocA family protein [Vibrio cholerae]